MSAQRFVSALVRTTALTLMLTAISATSSQAANLTVVAGTGTVGGTPTNLTLNQTSSKLVGTSNDFNFSSGGSFTATTPAYNSITYIVVSGGATSWATGSTITSNGQLIVVNPGGFTIGNAHVNASSTTLSTAGISNATGDGFMTNAGTTYVYDQAGNPTASINVNQGVFTATGNPAKGGDIILLAPQVSVNGGSMITPGGQIQLLAGETFTADFTGDGLLNFAVIDSGVTTKATNGATASVEVTNGAALHGGIVTAGAEVFQDAVLDHVINLGGQYEVGTYTNGATNPQHVVITTAPHVYETILPNPTTAVTLGSNANDVNTIRPLTRSQSSLANETSEDTTVNPTVANVSYERPYRVDINTSISEGALTLLAPAAGNAQNGTAVSLGNLSPSAGGNQTVASASNLGDLSPAAGGASKSVSCANSFLAAGFNDPTSSSCAN